MSHPYRLFAHYNAEMNQRLYQAASQLNATELSRERGAFFGSIFGTMNHLIVADILWLQRFAQLPPAYQALAPLRDWPTPQTLDQAVCSDLASWWDKRCLLDQCITQLAQQLQPQHLALTLHYTNSKGLPCHKHFGSVLQHFFNHQTHHRGQASTLLFQAGIDMGVTDLITFVPDSA